MNTTQIDPFEKAVREKFKLKIALFGASGAGKTYGALQMASRIIKKEGGGKIAFLDSEGRSSRIYGELFDFYAMDLFRDYNPDLFIAAIQDAQDFGYSVLIIDSLSPAWNRKGGILEIVDSSKLGNNKISGWLKGRPAQDALVDAIVRANIHIIITTRAKTEWVAEEKKGGISFKKNGVGMIQSGELEHELQATFLMDMDHHFNVSKSRCMEINAQGGKFDNCDMLTDILHKWSIAGEGGFHSPLPEWVTTKNIDSLFATWRKEGLSDDKILAHVNVASKYDLEQWRKYPTGQDASNIIKTSLTKAMKNLPAATAKTPPAPPVKEKPGAASIPPITPETPKPATKVVWETPVTENLANEFKNYGLGTFAELDEEEVGVEALLVLNKERWQDFDTPLAASLAIRAWMLKNRPPLIAHNGIWRGKHTDLLVNESALSGGLTIQVIDIAKIAKLGEEWKDASQEWEQDKPIEFHDPINILEWKVTGTKSIAVKIGVGNIPF